MSDACHMSAGISSWIDLLIAECVTSVVVIIINVQELGITIGS